MKIFLLSIFIVLSCLPIFSQFNFPETESYARQDTNLASVTELRLKGDGSWRKTAFEQFNKGKKELRIEYDKEGEESNKKLFAYDQDDHLIQCVNYANNKLGISYEFAWDNGLQRLITSYITSNSTGEKKCINKIYFYHNPNRTLKKTISTSGTPTDTLQICVYDSTGVLQQVTNSGKKSMEYKWNEDKTEMQELHFKNDSIYKTVIYKFKDKEIVEKSDSTHWPKPVYWKYDKKDRLIETNEQLYYISYFSYGKKGWMTKAKHVPTLKEDKAHASKPICFKYEYEFKTKQ